MNRPANKAGATTLRGLVVGQGGGARVTFWTFAVMAVGVVSVLRFIDISERPEAFQGFFISFIVLFVAAGVGCASTRQMIPHILRRDMIRLLPDADDETRLRQAERESAAIIGFTEAIAALAFFLIPVLFSFLSWVKALLVLLAFDISCLLITFVFYSRPGGLLHDDPGDQRIPLVFQ